MTVLLSRSRVHVEQDAPLWPTQRFAELNTQALNIDLTEVIDGKTKPSRLRSLPRCRGRLFKCIQMYV